jgi:hypothetical protein
LKEGILKAILETYESEVSRVMKEARLERLTVREESNDERRSKGIASYNSPARLNTASLVC